MFSQTVLIVILMVLVGVIVYLAKKLTDSHKQAPDKALYEWLHTMQASLDRTNKSLNERLSTNSSDMVKVLQQNSRELNERLDRASSVIREVGIEVGQMSEIGRSMRELQDFLKSPKLRGTIGEQVLKDLITQIFPKNSFHLQYQFASGDKVDAVIKTDAGILPIDAKFPMENFVKMAKAETAKEKAQWQNEFVKDVKKHIDAIAKKYILPSEGTMDFALMYVPSESVFYELVNIDDITQYTQHKRVYIVSPSTLYAHLQTILLSFEGKKIESQSREVFRILQGLTIDYDKLTEQLDVLGRHVGNASNQLTNVTKSVTNMGNKLHSVRSLEADTSGKEKVLD